MVVDGRFGVGGEGVAGGEVDDVGGDIDAVETVAGGEGDILAQARVGADDAVRIADGGAGAAARQRVVYGVDGAGGNEAGGGKYRVNRARLAIRDR